MSMNSQCLPLSENQRGLWHLQNIHPELYIFNSSAVFRVRAQLNIPRLQQKLFHLSEQHPLLRTTFVLQDDTPLQVRHETLHPDFDHMVVDAVDEAELQILVQAAHDRPFDLVTGPLVRLALFTRADDDHVLLLTFHHILIDFGTIAKLTQQLFDLYAGDQDKAPILTNHFATPTGYDEFVAWQQEHLTGPAAAKLRDYWSQQLQAPLPILDLPTDHPLPRQQTFNGSTIRFALPNSLSQTLLKLAHQHQVTPFTLLLTAYALLLARYGNHDDLIIGIPSDERLRAPQRFRQTLGHMVNALPIRFNLADRPTFVDLLQQTQRTVLNGIWRQNYPFTYMVQDAQVPRDISRFPLFDVMFNMPVLHKEMSFIPWLEGTTAHPVIYQDLPLEPFALDQQTVHTFLELTVWSTETGIVGVLKYNSDLFTQARAEVMAAQYQHLLTQISADATRTLDAYSLVTPAMQSWLPDLSTPIAEPPYDLVPMMISQWVNRTPNYIAITQGAAAYSYQQVMDMTLGIARWLCAQKLPKGAVIAIQGANSPLLVASMLAVLRNGQVFVLLDPTLPLQRRQTMMAVAQPKAYILLGEDIDAHSQLNAPDLSVLHLCSSTKVSMLVEPNDDPAFVWPTLSPDDPAYIFFTSGTTGTPKGIVGTHKGLAHFLDWQRATFAVTPTDRVAQLTALSFDAVLRAIFLPLVSGATLVLPEMADTLLAGETVLAWLDKNRITLVHVVPSLAQAWLLDRPATATLQTLRWLFFSGEPLTGAFITQWREAFPDSGEIVNLYGPTETTLVKCYYQAPAKVQPGVQPIGHPQPATQVVVIKQGRLCGVGELGEIMIRTPFRTQGYIQRHDTFAQNPFSAAANDLVYYTGDYGRLRPDGLIDILGRLDTQVKIRGVRIELQEIEAVLMRHPQVQKAVVVAQGEAVDKRLVAYLIPTNPLAETPFLAEAVTRQSNQPSANRAPNPPQHFISSIRTFLQQTLPGYMIPAAFVLLDAIPLLPNGKLDRRALPAPDDGDAASEFVAPRTAVEAQLATIWQQLLQRERVGVYDNFFALGGHSMLATQVISRVRMQLHVELRLRTLFENPTVAGLAEQIETVCAAPQHGDNTDAMAHPASSRNFLTTIPTVPRDQPLPASYMQERLWAVAQSEGDAEMVTAIALRLRGRLHQVALEQSWQELVRRHESFRTAFTMVDGQLMQIFPPIAFKLRLVDLSAYDAMMQADQVKQLVAENERTPFNPRTAPLFRVTLLRLHDEEHLLLFAIHHILTDAWSNTVLGRELALLYNVFVHGEPSPLPDLPFQYADYAVWQRNRLQGKFLAEQVAYWRRQLHNAPRLALPTDYPRCAPQPFSPGVQIARLPATLLVALERLSKHCEATLFICLLAAFQVLLMRYSRQEDIVVGTQHANRTRAELESLIGWFVNAQALRTDLRGNPSFREVVKRVRQTVLDAHQYQELPIRQVEEALGKTGEIYAFYQTFFMMQNAAHTALDFTDLQVSIEEKAEVSVPGFDLSLRLMPGEQGLFCVWGYNRTLFAETTIQHLVQRFQALLESSVNDPDQPIQQLPW